VVPLLPTQFDVVGRIEPANVLKYMLQLDGGTHARQLVVYKMTVDEGVSTVHLPYTYRTPTVTLP